EIDPDFSAPHAGLAFATVSEYVNGWVAEPAQALEEAERWARRAIELEDRDPNGHVALANVLLWCRKHDVALAEVDRAVGLDHNYAQAHGIRGLTLMYSGRADEALESFAKAMRLDPLYPNILLHLVAQAHFSLGQYEIAAAHLLDRIGRNPETDA